MYHSKCPQPHEEGHLIISILQTMKLRHRALSAFAQGLTAAKWSSQNLNCQALGWF